MRGLVSGRKSPKDFADATGEPRAPALLVLTETNENLVNAAKVPGHGRERDLSLGHRNARVSRKQEPFSMTQEHVHRRLSDKLLAAFQQACDQRDIEIAEQILKALELALTREEGKGRSADRRGDTGPAVEAFTRLVELKRALARGGA